MNKQNNLGLKIYNNRRRLVLLGLTGRTGSGCSTLASILKRKSFDELDLHDPDSYKFETADDRKYSIIYNFMKSNNWSPFSVVEISSVILSFVFSGDKTDLIKYIETLMDKEADNRLTIDEWEKCKDTILRSNYMFTNVPDFESLENGYNDLEAKDIDKEYETAYIYCTKTINEMKRRFKIDLSAFSCKEITENEYHEKKETKCHLYTYLMQHIGNNLRASGSPYDPEYSHNTIYMERINMFIKIILKHDEKLVNSGEIPMSRICIDAIRNPYEAHYLHDKYRAFSLIAINTEDSNRPSRLDNMNKEELEKLDEIEHPSGFNDPNEIFYHQNIQGCLEVADIHIHNSNMDDMKFYDMTEQVIKYIALMLHPGLVTPTKLERCMQLAYTSKYNSGCLSRQVGAIVTGNDFSVKAVGWNDVAEGQVPCNMRDIRGFCCNKDKETYSEFERTNEEFNEVAQLINSGLDKLYDSGRFFPYCFKDIYNGLKGDKNQVHTRALHAEENAFLQISKYGGQGLKNGKLFTTASPCEMCAKKAYQLGIREIYYIDPYPGISKSHILSIGEAKKPKMNLFRGAIGNAYMSLYSQRLAYKDELELISDINCKQTAKNKTIKQTKKVDAFDIDYKNVSVEMRFTSRECIEVEVRREGTLNDDTINELNHKCVWTGTAYDGSEMVNKPEGMELKEYSSKESPHRCTVVIDREVFKGPDFAYSIVSKMKDEKRIMEPFCGCVVRHLTENLSLRVICPKGLMRNVKGVIYADVAQKYRIEDISIKTDPENKGNDDQYEFPIETPNLFYSYLIEWEFNDNYVEKRTG